MGKLCQQRLLLAGLAFLCFFLPLIAGPAAQTALSRGVGFSGIQLAIVAPEGDPVPEQLEQILSGMQDVRKYCHVEAMEYQQAVSRLEQGAITAVLVLPEQFVQGVMNGTNPDVTLLVPADRPLEALLTIWIGQSASDLLAAIQNGIYAVLELYSENPPAGLSYGDVVGRINLRYISWMMNRQDLYRVQTIPVAGSLPVGLHYSLSLFVCLMLSLAPMFAVVYDAKWIRAQRRFRAVGMGAGLFFSAAVTACWLVEALLITVFQIIGLKAAIPAALVSGALCGLFCSAYGSLCCLLTADTGSCGALSFSGALVFLVLSGGILPPVLMPGFLQNWIKLSPVTWLRTVMAMSAGYDPQPAMAAALAVSALVMILAGSVLFKRRADQEVTSL